jgi:hypothetical protein
MEHKILSEDLFHIIVENHLEYDDKIIEKIIYFVTKASGNYNYQFIIFQPTQMMNDEEPFPILLDKLLTDFY